jgi:hypothetical protein
MISNLQKIKNYNYLYSRMKAAFVTGLKLKNNLTSQLVTPFFYFRISLSPLTETMSSGTLVGLLSIPIVTWDTLGSFSLEIRNYLCNDMIKRVLRDHFGYNVQVTIRNN